MLVYFLSDPGSGADAVAVQESASRARTHLFRRKHHQESLLAGMATRFESLVSVSAIGIDARVCLRTF